MTKLIIFDLDGTLTESKQPLTDDMAALVAELLSVKKVAVISGGALPQFLKQVVAKLPSNANLANLYILPTTGAALYEFNGGDWKRVYEERLTEKEAETIEEVIHAVAEETGIVDFSEPSYGERIEYRGSQVTISALGQDAPVAEKMLWDPDYAKRKVLQEKISARLPKFSVSFGGKTSIDVTKKGIDKAYGIQQLCKRLGISESDSLYVGDELKAGGNDEAVYKTGAATCEVENPSDTIRTIKSILATE